MLELPSLHLDFTLNIETTWPSIHLILLCLLCEQQPGALPLNCEGGHHQPLVPVVHQLGLWLTSLQGGIREFWRKYWVVSISSNCFLLEILKIGWNLHICLGSCSAQNYSNKSQLFSRQSISGANLVKIKSLSGSFQQTKTEHNCVCHRG